MHLNNLRLLDKLMLDQKRLNDLHCVGEIESRVNSLREFMANSSTLPAQSGHYRHACYEIITGSWHATVC